MFSPPVATGVTLAAQVLLTRGRSGSRVARLAAAGIGIASIAVAIGAQANFRRQQTTVNPVYPEKSTSLVVTGPNSLTRNPMYVGMVGCALAHGLWRGSARALLPAAGLFLWLDRVQIPAEEEALDRLYGRKYRDYLSGVPRWLGRSSGKQRGKHRSRH